MTTTLRIRGPEGPLRGTVRLPSSKSIANRALICADLAGDPHLVRGIGEADDTLRIAAALRRTDGPIDCGLGGTTLRFLMAWAAVQEGRVTELIGASRLLQRPHDPLVRALVRLGAEVERTDHGYRVHGQRLAGGHIELDSPVSSQFISALLLVAPVMELGLVVQWTGHRVSEPYVDMTCRTLRAFGATVRVEGRSIAVSPSTLSPKAFTVPVDWSAAAFWAEAVALVPGSRLLLEGLACDGWQGDEALLDLWSAWVGHEVGSDGVTLFHRPRGAATSTRSFNLVRTPDLFPALAATCAGLGAAVRIEGLENLPLKESDRVSAMAGLLRSGGVHVEHDGASAALVGHWSTQADLVIDPHGDHRLAMALAPMAALGGSLLIQDPDVVGKSYPGYWEQLRSAGFGVAQGAH